MSIVIRFLAVAWVQALTDCGGSGAGPEPAVQPVAVEALGSGTYAVRYEYRRIRIARQGAAATYGIWFPPPNLAAGQRGPAVLLSDP